MGNLENQFLKIKNKVSESFKGVFLNDFPPSAKHGVNAAPTISAMKSFSERYSLSSILPYESYDETTSFYYNKDSVGMVFIASPASKLGVQDIGILNSIFSDENRTGTCIQVSLVSDPNFDSLLDEWAENKEKSKNLENRDVFKFLTKKRLDYFTSGRWNSLFDDESFLIRDIHLLISYTLPFDRKVGVSTETIEYLKSKKNIIASLLKSAQIYVEDLPPKGLINIFNPLLNPSLNHKATLEYDEFNPISSQIVAEDTMMLLGASASNIIHEDKIFSLIPFHIRQFPRSWRAYLNGNLIGDFLSNSKRISCPYIITMTVRVPDQTSSRSKAGTNLARSTQMADAPIAKFATQWFERKEDWSYVTKRMDANDKLLDMFFQAILICPEGKEDQARQEFKALYKSNSWEVSASRYVPLHALLGALPMGLDQMMHQDLKRFGHYSTKLSWNCANLAPWIGEWKGTVTPLMMFLGRKGQLSFFNHFDNDKGNYNLACYATSGSGKSFLTQELTVSILASGGRVFVIDAGGSYANICELLGGSYIDFSQNNINLNPFSKIFSSSSLEHIKELSKQDSSYSLRDYMNDFMPLLIELISQMASPNMELEQIKKTFLEMAISHAVEKQKEKTTISTVVEELSALSNEEMGEHAKELSLMLYSFTKDGMYSRYFEGESNINFNNDFVVLEMDSLKNKGILKSIVLQILIIQINQAMYLSGNRKQAKQVIIDEAWQLLDEGRSGRFIEEGYRVARKHGGSFMTITQSINDYFKSNISKAALENSDFTIALRQKNESMNTAVSKGYIDNSDGSVDIIKTLTTEKGKYSELVIKGPNGISLLRLVVDSFSQKLFSTTPSDVAFIKETRAQGVGLVDAINLLLKESK